MNKRLLILTGPQGSGNHLWSKIFSEDPSVQGWKQLIEKYWVGHGDEPFVNIWEDPRLFSSINWTHNLYFTSISCPYITNGGPTLPENQYWEIPKYEEFIEAAQTAGFQTQIVIIGRDKNILEYQQSRVRKEFTLPIFLEILDQTLEKYEPFFVSTEQVYLYEQTYLNQISKILDWPINISQERLKNILKDDSNKKYLAPVDKYWLDDVMANTKNGSKNNPYVYKSN